MVFRAIKTQLPLLVDSLQQVKRQAELGNVDLETQKALIPVIDECLEQVSSLEESIQKIVPVAGDSSWQRSRKALARSVSRVPTLFGHSLDQRFKGSIPRQTRIVYYHNLMA